MEASGSYVSDEHMRKFDQVKDDYFIRKGTINQ